MKERLKTQEQKSEKKLPVRKMVVTQQTEELDEKQLEEVAGGNIRCSFELVLVGGFTTRFTNG